MADGHAHRDGASAAGGASRMSADIHRERILILDFGAQYTQLIARRVREAGVYCEIRAFDLGDAAVRGFAPSGIILSGGPESVTLAGTPRAPAAVFTANVPVLGICYGMQAMAVQLGGAVSHVHEQEFGHARVSLLAHGALFADVMDGDAFDAWMSHGDQVTALPPGFHVLAATATAPIAAMAHETRRFYAVQFHPEVTHTARGAALLKHFVRDICGCQGLWTAANIIDDAIARIRAQVGSDKVVLGLSGGVDSSVVAALLARAIGTQITAIFVDNGLLRLGEGDEVMKIFAGGAENANALPLQLRRVDAQEEFLGALIGVSDPTTPWMREARLAQTLTADSVVLFALDQFCLIGYPLPLSRGMRRATFNK